MRDMDHGRETEADAKAQALAEAAEEYAAIAHVDE
jgi:hypothetical protein